MKNISIFVTIGIFLISMIAGAGKLMAQASASAAKVEKLEDKIETVKEKSDKNDVRQEAIKEKVEGIDDKLDKVLDMLIRQAKENK